LKGIESRAEQGSNVHYLLVRRWKSRRQIFRDRAGVSGAGPTPVRRSSAAPVDAWVIWDPFQAAAEAATGARTLADGSGIVSNYQFYSPRRSS